MQRRPLLMLAAGCVLPAGRAALAEPGLWPRLQDGGLVLLIRHAATAPGIGDPPDFVLAECRTQRNLSAAGRRDAQALGAALGAHRVPLARVRSSRWCRCLDTARLAFGHAEPEPLLDSLFRQDDGRARAQTATLLARLTGPDPAPARAGNTVLVTHDVNIRALVGLAVAPGEAVALRPAASGLEVLGRLWRPG